MEQLFSGTDEKDSIRILWLVIYDLEWRLFLN